MNTEPISTAIDHYLSNHQIREDIVDLPDDGIDWEKRVSDTKDKLQKLYDEGFYDKGRKDISHNLVSYGEANTLHVIMHTIGVYDINPPLHYQRWCNYLGKPFPDGAAGKVVVLLSDEGVLFANEIARRLKIVR